jgi:thiol-disulfide isomerase/thioredoxin
MQRRDLLARAGLVAGSLGVLGGGAYVATNGLGADADRLPMTVETIDAPGSTAGEATVPTPGVVTVVDVFATWCRPCVEQMDHLVALDDATGDDVRVVSATTERLGGGFTRADVRRWFVDNGGDWTLALDPANELLSALGGATVPFVAVAAPDGSVTWTDAGVATAAALRTQVERARDDDS